MRPSQHWKKLSNYFFHGLFQLGVWWVRVCLQLPFPWLLKIGRALGRCAFSVAKYRRKISEINIQKCFPKLDQPALQALVKANFESMGMGAMESFAAWWMNDRRFRKISFRIVGLENLLEAESSGKGVLLCCAHFTCLEMIGRYFHSLRDYSLVYRKFRDPWVDRLIAKGRSRYGQLVSREDIRSMMSVLKSGGLLFYAPDQDFGESRSVFAPFFNIQTATLKFTGTLAKATSALVLPVMYNRAKTGLGYELHILPKLQNFPSADLAQDARRYNEILEAHIRKFPEQYLWMHRRFKTRPKGERSFY